MLAVEITFEFADQFVDIDTHIAQQYGGASVFLAEDAEEDMLRPTIILTKLLRNIPAHSEREFRRLAQALGSRTDDQCARREIERVLCSLQCHARIGQYLCAH